MRSERRSGFTLLEMLVVVGIIVLLVSILLPVVGTVRKTAYQTRSANLVVKLATAINNYYNDFKAYPGPLSDDQLDNPNLTPPIQGLKGNVTGSENLVLGLLGGLKVQSTNGSIAYDASLVGKGPASINQLNPKLYSPYVDFNPSELSPMSTAGGTPTFMQEGNMDSAVPEFMDAFPDPDTRPIIYARARVGATGVTTPAAGSPPNTKAQYNPKDASAYFMSPKPPDRFEPQTTFPLMFPDKRTVTADQFFGNPATIPQGQTTPTDARGKDKFILIQAGKDRIFGTGDDYYYP